MRRISLAIALVSSVAAGQGNLVQPLETLPGFRANQAFSPGVLDDVALYSGDVQLRVPLGPEFVLSPGVTWRMTAAYSARLYHQWSAPCGSQVVCGSPEYHSRARVGGTTALGAGWSLEVSHVIAGSTFPGEDPWPRYRNESGALTRIDPVTGAPEDGSLAVFSSSPFWAMKRADGTTWEYEHAFLPPPSANAYDFNDDDRLNSGILRYGLSRIKDRLGNVVLTVNYVANHPSTDAWRVSSIDLGGGRVISYSWSTYQRDASSALWVVVDSVTFPAPHGGTLTATFQRAADGRFVRTEFDGGGPLSCPVAGPHVVDGPVLSRITVGGQAIDFASDVGDPTFTSPTGLLTGYTLPTGGQVQYTWQPYTALAPCIEGNVGCNPEIDAPPLVIPRPDPPGEINATESCTLFRRALQPFIDSTPAVIKRREIDPVNGTDATTTFTRKQYGGRLHRSGPPELDGGRVVRQVTITRPNGNGGRNATKHVFTVSISGPGGGELLRRTYDDDNAAGTPSRSIVYCYDTLSGEECGVLKKNRTVESDFVAAAEIGAGLEKRSAETTWYGPNPTSTDADPITGPGSSCTELYTRGCWYVRRSNWNAGAREYGTESVGTDFNGTGPNAALVPTGFLRRDTTTAWTPTTLANGAWLPKNFTSRTIADVYTSGCPDAPCSVTTSQTYDASGNIATRSISDSRPGFTAGITATYVYTSGDPTTETVTGSGAVTGTLSTTRTYQNHQVATTTRNPFTFKSFDVTRDSLVGLITQARDANATLVTNFTYDSLGRLVSIAPPGESSNTFCYVNYSAGVPAYTVAKKGYGSACSTNDGSPSPGAGTIEAYGYDGFGRLTREVKKLPGLPTGSLAVRATLRNDAGQVRAITEWESCGAGHDLTTCLTLSPNLVNRTSFSNFDAFGRWRTRVGADGARTTRHFDDPASIPQSDFTEIVTAEDVNNPPGSFSGSNAYSGTRRDIFGRALVVALPGDAPFGPLTTHFWNVLDKPSRVIQARPDDTPLNPQQQIRSWSYDTLGNLRSETTPEAGTSSHSSFDVLGNTLSSALPDGIALNTRFDTLGRLASRWHGAVTTGVLYEERFYDGNGFAGGAYPLGKETRRTTYNRSGSFEHAFAQDDNAYDGLGGRISTRTTRLYRAGGGSTVFDGTQTFSWNALGLLASHGHPRHGGGTWTVANTYALGLPTSITADGAPIVTSALYAYHGGLRAYTTGNNVTTTITPDLTGLPRPAGISTSGATPTALNLSTGTFLYDGRGSIRGLQRTDLGLTDTFTYDKAGRLKTATFPTLATPAPTDEFEYDGTSSGLFGLGNLTKRTTDGAATSLNVDLVTNRLAAAAYDGRGNMTAFGPKAYTYDAVGRRTRYAQAGSTENYLYGLGDERIARVVPTSTVQELPRATRFYPLAPCRLVDTRDSTPLTPNSERMVSASGVCGIPSNATALSANVTGINASAETGFVRAYPAGLGSRPIMSSTAVVPSKTRATFNLIGINGPTAGSFTLLSDMPSANVDAIVDVAGYFAPSGSAPSGNSWYVSLRDGDGRLITDYRYDEGSGTRALLTDHVYLGAHRVATLGSTPTGGVSLGLAFYSNDHLGTPRLAHGYGGVVLGTYRYRAFGAPFTGTTSGQGPEFAMMERDGGSRDHYVHARYYSDWIGRFQSPDSVEGAEEHPGTWNRYAYALNDPLGLVDPDGLAPKQPYVTVAFRPTSSDFKNADIGKVVLDRLSTYLQTGLFSPFAKEGLLRPPQYYEGSRATRGRFTAGLGDKEGVSVFVGHGQGPAGVGLIFADGYSSLSKIQNQNAIVCIAACYSSQLAPNFGVAKGEKQKAFIGVVGKLDTVVLTRIAAEFTALLHQGLSAGDIAKTLQQKYGNSVVLIGNPNASANDSKK